MQISSFSLISPTTDKKYKLKPLMLLCTLFITSILASNILASKVMVWFNFNVPAGVVAYALVFWCTDVIGEIWGKRIAYYFVFLGFVANLVLLLLIQLAIMSPAAIFWGHQAAYEQTLGNVWLIVLASMTAYLVSQLHDIWAFDFWRRLTQGKKLWLRNILSTVVSQTIDSVLFVVIAFASSLPFNVLMSMIIGQLVIKWGLALFDTPFIYLAIKWLETPIDGAHGKISYANT